MSKPPETIVVVGASAGGVEALCNLVSQLPVDFPSTILIAHHQAPQARSMMPAILSRSGLLPARHATGNEPIQPGHIYIAPPDWHMLIKGDSVVLGRGPRENCTRPAIDPLFRTAAAHFGSHVIGVVLTGNLDDGTAGLSIIKECGGITIVQDPAEALYPGMPESAISHVDVDYILPVNDIGTKITQLVAHGRPEGETKMCSNPEDSNGSDPAEGGNIPSPEALGWGTPSLYACPDCHGTLWEKEMPSGLLRFRCRVGHAYTEGALAAMQSDRIQEALWIALRALEERGALVERLAQRSRNMKQMRNLARYQEQKQELDAQAKILREVISHGHVDAGSEA